MKWLSFLFGIKIKNEQVLESAHAAKNKEFMKEDESYMANVYGDLDDMLRVLPKVTKLLDRHFLLLSIVEQAYKLRNDPKYRNICITYSEIHIKEFGKGLKDALLEEFKVMPRVPTFQYYATLLTEDGNFSKAIEICELAISYNLSDGTKSNFQGRIQRIRKKISSS